MVVYSVHNEGYVLLESGLLIMQPGNNGNRNVSSATQTGYDTEPFIQLHPKL